MTLPLNVAPTPAASSRAAGAATLLEFTVHGLPAPQGSKVAMPIYRGSRAKGTREFTGKSALVESSSQKLGPWRDAVRSEAVRAHGGRPPLDGPLALTIIFALPRPKSARKSDIYPIKRPDLDKLARAVGDAIKQAGVVVDDSLFCDEFIRKRFAGFPGALAVPGARISISSIEET